MSEGAETDAEELRVGMVYIVDRKKMVSEIFIALFYRFKFFVFVL
jgi:hypothetical protein